MEGITPCLPAHLRERGSRLSHNQRLRPGRDRGVAVL